MNRLLLALLALFAGLATQIAPAQARAAGGDAAQVGAAAVCRNARPSPSSIAEPELPQRCETATRRDAALPMSLRPRVPVPAVLFGPDRAFE
jgi:hypothetical protein